MKSAHPLPKQAKVQIANAIAAAERRTSAELKVIICRHCWADLREKARSLFYKHKLDQTKQRNAVMIFLVLVERQFLVYGDQGIHEKVGDDFWLEVCDVMRKSFQQGSLAEGVCKGIEVIGAQLAAHFPRDKHDSNEISDEVIGEA
ncbi:MAG: TPM domain-containing protein [Planctomycetota bacterium]